MIIGIGIDIVSIQEMEESLQEEAFSGKVFTSTEVDAVQRYRNKAEHLAGKFAAKEAFMKAIGAGLQQEVGFTQIEVVNDDAGKPYINVSGEAGKRLYDCGAKHIHISISHAGGVAAAVIILEG